MITHDLSKLLTHDLHVFPTVEWVQWHAAQTRPLKLDPHSTASGRVGILSQQSGSSELALAKEGPRLKPHTERQAIPGCKSPVPWPQIGSLPRARASLGLRSACCLSCMEVQLLFLLNPASFTTHPSVHLTSSVPQILPALHIFLSGSVSQRTWPGTHSIMVKRMGSGLWLPGFESWPWANYHLNFLLITFKKRSRSNIRSYHTGRVRITWHNPCGSCSVVLGTG